MTKMSDGQFDLLEEPYRNWIEFYWEGEIGLSGYVSPLDYEDVSVRVDTNEIELVSRMLKRREDEPADREILADWEDYWTQRILEQPLKSEEEVLPEMSVEDRQGYPYGSRSKVLELRYEEAPSKTELKHSMELLEEVAENQETNFKLMSDVVGHFKTYLEDFDYR
ncbi:MAG: hypothetical protein ABEJ64_01320 [Candidatus Nanohaloarchaea archaeon]